MEIRFPKLDQDPNSKKLKQLTNSRICQIPKTTPDHFSVGVPISVFDNFQSSKLVHSGGPFGGVVEDGNVAQLRQRRLNQPFAWHQDPDINEEVDNFSEEEVPTQGNGASHEKEKESSPSDVKIVPSTCRNSVHYQREKRFSGLIFNQGIFVVKRTKSSFYNSYIC